MATTTEKPGSVALPTIPEKYRPALAQYMRELVVPADDSVWLRITRENGLDECDSVKLGQLWGGVIEAVEGGENAIH